MSAAEGSKLRGNSKAPWIWGARPDQGPRLAGFYRRPNIAFSLQWFHLGRAETGAAFQLLDADAARALRKANCNEGSVTGFSSQGADLKISSIPSDSAE